MAQAEYLKKCQKFEADFLHYGDGSLHEMKEPPLIDIYKKALADAIRRPMGIVPASAEGLVDDGDLARAEARRPPLTVDDWATGSPNKAPDGQQLF